MDTLVDTHCHLNHPDFASEVEAVVRRAAEAGVGRILCVGYDLPSSMLAAKLAEQNQPVYAAVGVHPHDAAKFGSDVEKELATLAFDSQRVVAIGETGLDYLRNLSPREVQQAAYRKHIRLAHSLELPLIVHSRDASEDVLAILEQEGAPASGVVMHCFPGDSELAAACLARRCYVGIAGPITFHNADKLREAARSMPLDRLLVETDAPYLSPHPERGRRNEPAYLPLIAHALARAMVISPAEIAARTTENAVALFGLD